MTFSNTVAILLFSLEVGLNILCLSIHLAGSSSILFGFMHFSDKKEESYTRFPAKLQPAEFIHVLDLIYFNKSCFMAAGRSALDNVD